MGSRQCGGAGRLNRLLNGPGAKGEAGRTPHTSGPSMRDAPPPPLDRQGIGRFPYGRRGAPTPDSTTPSRAGYARMRDFFGAGLRHGRSINGTAARFATTSATVGW
ncbi:hypothetical protein GCM10010109_44880 [Actinoplanes campanulatus]|nr:hypothetical protein GCM10010109_44880 [Actinoplanes campanulatus]GID38019.1 hypothetical protein Aca09nite_45250 [Actinoplanes campanulatus]